MELNPNWQVKSISYLIPKTVGRVRVRIWDRVTYLLSLHTLLLKRYSATYLNGIINQQFHK